MLAGVTQATPTPQSHLQRSSRDAASVPAAIAAWLADLLPTGADPQVVLHSGVDSNGMSSETLLLDVTWTHDGVRRVGRYVARVEPAAGDVPVFPRYALADQREAMRLAAELSEVPVPAVRWLEPTGQVLGTPFFLMDRVEGRVPPDVLPYPFGDNWLFDAEPAQQRALQDGSVGLVAALHAIPGGADRFAFLDPARAGHDGSTALARNLARLRAWYDFAVPGVGRSATVERCLAWLEGHLPATEEAVLCWGDARIGNVIYEGFAPVAVLDWEMATVGPRELDVSWMLFAHQVFQGIAETFELPGMPHFLREDDVRAAYAEAGGGELGDLRWYHVFNAAQWCVVFMRTGARQLHFGEIERPDDVDALFHHRPIVERLLDEAGA